MKQETAAKLDFVATGLVLVGLVWGIINTVENRAEIENLKMILRNPPGKTPRVYVKEAPKQTVWIKTENPNELNSYISGLRTEFGSRGKRQI